MNGRIISERTTAGLAVAKARGRTGGRPTVTTPERIAVAQRMREEKRRGGASRAACSLAHELRRALAAPTPSELAPVG